jgi:hypothetical protein
MKETVVGALREEISGNRNGMISFGTKTKKPTIEIIDYGCIVKNEDQIMIGNISILGDLKFESLEISRFKLHSKNECDDLVFKIQERTISLKYQTLPILLLDEILSKIYWENKKVKENTFLQKMQTINTQSIAVINDDFGKKCFLTLLFGDNHKKSILIRSEDNMTEYLFPGNYLLMSAPSNREYSF